MSPLTLERLTKLELVLVLVLALALALALEGKLKTEASHGLGSSPPLTFCPLQGAVGHSFLCIL